LARRPRAGREYVVTNAPAVSALDRFFEHYYHRRPVNATFTGVHAYDRLLPDWSPAGLEALCAEMTSLVAALDQEYPEPRPSDAPAAFRANVDLLDARLASDFLAIQLAEIESGHGMRANPAWWTGEAMFGVIALMTREFAPREERFSDTMARLDAMPAFFQAAQRTLDPTAIPPAWAAKAIREIDGGRALLTGGIARWTARRDSAGADRVRSAAARALSALSQFADWLRAQASGSDATASCGADYLDLLLARGHRCARPRAELLAEARERFDAERERLAEDARAVASSWADVQELIAQDHPAPQDYFAAFEQTWVECRESAARHDVISWPEWPIRYVSYPEFTRDAAPFLYYLHYRSPAPFDSYDVHDYVVPALPQDPAAHLRVWNNATIKLNHVVHHGAIGHHVQNWFAYHRAPTRIGKIAAVDCACRLAMFSGGTMAEGWACYVSTVMDEIGFLTPLERLADQHTRLRGLARAIVDLELHQGTMTLDDAARFYQTQVGMNPEPARNEAVKNSMFPGAAIIYWLGTQSILDLRATLQRQRGPAWNLRAFHDEFLSHGAIPVPLIAAMMTSTAPPA
jgi:hypothetical protein